MLREQALELRRLHEEVCAALIAKDAWRIGVASSEFDDYVDALTL